LLVHPFTHSRDAISRISFQIPFQWLLAVAKEVTTQLPLAHYIKKKRKHAFRMYLVYTCQHETQLDVDTGSFQTNSIYVTLAKAETPEM
jgi:hypothetical protein